MISSSALQLLIIIYDQRKIGKIREVLANYSLIIMLLLFCFSLSY